MLFCHFHPGRVIASFKYYRRPIIVYTLVMLLGHPNGHYGYSGLSKIEASYTVETVKTVETACMIMLKEIQPEYVLGKLKDLYFF